MKNIIKIGFLFLVFTNFAHSQCEGIENVIKISEDGKTYKGDNTIRKDSVWVYPYLKKNQESSSIKVYSYCKESKGVIIKNSNPDFIKVTTDVELKLNDTYALFEDRGIINNYTHYYSREFKLEFDSSAETKYGTLAVHSIGGGKAIKLFYRLEGEKSKTPIIIVVTDFDNSLFIADSIGNPEKDKIKSIDFDTIELGKENEKKFTIVNNSIAEVKLSYGEKNRFTNASWGTFTPSLDSTTIGPFSEQEFTIILHPKKDSAKGKKDIHQVKIDTLQSNNSMDFDVSVILTDRSNFTKTVQVTSIFKAPLIEEPSSFIDDVINFYNKIDTYLLLLLLLCLVALIVDYKYFQKIVRRPSFQNIVAYLEKEQTNGGSPKEWQKALNKFKINKPKDPNGDDNTDDNNEDDDSEVNNLKEKIETLESENKLIKKEKETLSNELESLNKKLEDDAFYKNSFEKLSLSREYDINKHIEFVKCLWQRDIKDIQAVELIQHEKSTIKKLHNLLKNEGVAISSIENQQSLLKLESELSNIIAAHFTKYPDYVKEFSESTHEVLNELKNSQKSVVITDGLFTKMLDSILYGKTGKRGFTLAYEIISDDALDGQLANRLGLSSKHEFKKLAKKTFYQKFITSFKSEINTLSILFAYSQVPIINTKIQEEGIDIEALQFAYELLQQSLQDVDVRLILPKLFEESFDPKIYEMAQDSTLIYHFKSEIDELPSQVIYDIEKIAFETSFEGIKERENLVRVLYKP